MTCANPDCSQQFENPGGIWGKKYHSSDCRREHYRTLVRLKRFEKFYGLTEADYNSRVASCGGRCEICGKIAALYVDHDHALTPHDVRGMLCLDCNTGLGRFGDDPARLRAAAEYLEKGKP